MKKLAQAPAAKPILRGTSHFIAFFISLLGAIFLISLAQDFKTRLAVGIYALSLTLLFGISALYHVPTWTPRTRRFLKRLDHAAIFIVIAGSYAPFCLLSLDWATGTSLLKKAGIIAFVGILQSLFWINAPKVISFFFYFFLGWMVVPYFGLIIDSVRWSGASLILSAGIIYTVGALIYWLKRPNPWPAVFGYHEIFHALVIVASTCYFIVVIRMMHHVAVKI